MLSSPFPLLVFCGRSPKPATRICESPYFSWVFFSGHTTGGGKDLHPTQKTLIDIGLCSLLRLGFYHSFVPWQRDSDAGATDLKSPQLGSARSIPNLTGRSA